jgi:hypothetical protein
MLTAFGVKPPPYPTILDLDRKIRDFPVPVGLRPSCQGEGRDGEEDERDGGEDMRRWWVLSSKEASTSSFFLLLFSFNIR